MPSNNPSKEEPKPEVTIVPSETIDNSSKQEVIIDTTTGKPAENVVTTPSFDPNEIEKKISSKLFYELRQMEKRNKELLESLQKSQQVRPVRATENSDEDSEFERETEQIAQTDWKRAVDLRAQRLAEKITDKKMKEFQESQQKAQEEQNLKNSYLQLEERSKQKVLKEFPDLLDENSEVFKEYMGIFNREIVEDPYFMNNPRKHELVANELRARSGHSRPASNPEVDRLRRVAAGSSASNRSVPTQNRISLTQEEIDLCDKSGIPYASYARNKKILEKGGFKEGLELKS